jgi:uncharacterized protein (DUF302 family)
VTKTSRCSFAETVATLSEKIVAAGNTIFATIDQSAAAAGAGRSLRPTTLIVFGNPRGGTPFMQAFPLVALDLPLKLVVWQDAETVRVAYVPMSEIARRYGVTGMDVEVTAIDRALDALTAVVT